jgi:UDP-3-O-[3-hydroxymyristoyl] glucosamine N-acyltransferase
MQFTATQIAGMLQGTIEGDADSAVHNFAKIEEAQQGDLCFLANPKYEPFLYTTKASIVIVNSSLVLKDKVNATLIRVADAYAVFAVLLQQYELIRKQSFEKIGIEEPSYISEKASIGQNVYIGAFAYIGDGAVISDNAKIYPHCYIGAQAKVGANSVLQSGVKIYQECVVGANCILHSGVVIGSDGFGFALQSGQYNKIPQIGNVIINDHVEIGANTTIDRATMGSTVIGQGVKLDNLVQIAHNVSLGANTVIAAQAGISGSTHIGEDVIIGGQAGLVGHIHIAKGAKINAQSGVSKSIDEIGYAVTGTPAAEYKSVLKSQAIFKNLPKLQQQVNELIKKLEDLPNK